MAVDVNISGVFRAGIPKPLFKLPAGVRMLYGSIKASRQSNDCTCAAQANEIPAIRPEIATARIQAFNPASIANNEPLRGDRQHAIGPTV